MQQLTGLDASFLYLEQNRAPMHIGGVQIYDQSTVKGGVQGFKNILTYIEKRLPLAKSFRQKVVKVPFNLDHPYWIEDKDFDLEFHVRHIRLPAPGDWRQLCIQVARLHSRPLDLTKPLWEITVVEGLDGVESLPKGCYAVVSKIHHACIDGVSGVDITEALHDTEPDAAPTIVDTWKGETPPTDLELLSRAGVHNLLQPFRFLEVAARTVPALGRVGLGLADQKFHRAGKVPRTRFNHPVSAHRVFEAREFDVAEMRAIKNSVTGATINDLVLSVCGGALRKYLLANQELPATSLIAMAPISVRTKDGKGQLGNQVAAMAIAIGTEIEDPIERLNKVHANAVSSKALTNALGAKLMTDYSQFIPSSVAGMASRLYTRLGLANRTRPLFNCVITNVPGPQIPLYSAGAKLVKHFGLGPIYDGMGLIMPVWSYNGRLSISISACREMIPDPEFFAGCIQQAYDDVRNATIGSGKARNDASLESASQGHPDESPVRAR